MLQSCRRESRTQSPRSVVSTVFSLSTPSFLHNNLCGRFRQPPLVSWGGFSGSLAAHWDKYTQQLHKQESRMVVNVLLAWPQFSSTLMWRLILKHNNLELMSGSVSLREGRRERGVSGCRCTILHAAPQCLWMSMRICADRFKFTLIRMLHLLSRKTPQPKVQACYVKFPYVAIPCQWHQYRLRQATAEFSTSDLPWLMQPGGFDRSAR